MWQRKVLWKWYTCGGASQPEPDRLPPRGEKERFDDFPMFGVELTDPILLSMEGQASELLLWTAGANRAAKVLLTG